MKTFAGLIIALIVLLTSLLFGSCQSNQSAQFNTDDSGYFNTQDLALAQSQASFMIVLPAYVPKEAGRYPPRFSLPQKGVLPKGESEVNIRYQGSPEYWVRIKETQLLFTLDANEQSQYFEVNGTEILETPSSELESILNPTVFTSTSVPTLEYSWQKDGLLVIVWVGSYDRDEGRKIVASMF